MTKEIENWWNKTSKNYQKESKIETTSAHYGPCAPNENKLRLLGNVRGKKILEIGCGGGQCSIAFAKQGAKCTGLDLSKAQLKHAEDLAKKNKVNIIFKLHDIQTLKGIESNSYDVVFSAFALQYVPNLTVCFKEVNRVLKKGGVFVFSFDHPFYSIISPETLKVEKNYNKPGKYKSGLFAYYTRQFSEIFNSLQEAGFLIEQVIEPFDDKTEKAWTQGKWKKIYPKKLVMKVPPTVIFKAIKKV